MLAFVCPLLQVLPFVILAVLKICSLGTEQRKVLDLGHSAFRSSVPTTWNGQRQRTIIVKGGSDRGKAVEKLWNLLIGYIIPHSKRGGKPKKVLCIHTKKNNNGWVKSSNSLPHVKLKLQMEGNTANFFSNTALKLRPKPNQIKQIKQNKTKFFYQASQTRVFIFILWTEIFQWQLFFSFGF